MDKREAKLIHLTLPSNYESIKEAGILPTRRLTLRLKEFERKAAYFILDSDVKKWMQWKLFLKWLVHHVSVGGKVPRLGIISIPVSKLPENIRKNLYVVDRLPFQITQVEHPSFFKDNMLRMLYPYTIVPLDRYLQDPGLQETYQLPEVVAFTKIPLPEEHSFIVVERERLPGVIRRLFLKHG